MPEPGVGEAEYLELGAGEGVRRVGPGDGARRLYGEGDADRRLESEGRRPPVAGDSGLDDEDTLPGKLSPLLRRPRWNDFSLAFITDLLVMNIGFLL